MHDPYIAFYQSEIGLVRITASDKGIHTIYFVEDQPHPETVPDFLQDCVQQLDEFFQGKRRDFDLPLAPQGTAFQQRVWHKLLEIPYGTTYSYMDIALMLGDKNAVRAVGSANGKNQGKIRPREATLEKAEHQK